MRPATASRRWFGMAISVSTLAFSSRSPSSACFDAPLALEHERLGHHADGERAELLRDLARRPGAAPVPVPPPMPAVTKTMSAPLEMLGEPLDVFQRGALADLGVAAGAEAARELLAELQLHRREVRAQRLRVGVGGDELDAGQAGRDHRVDRVAAAAADADHLDPGPLDGLHQLAHHHTTSPAPRHPDADSLDPLEELPQPAHHPVPGPLERARAPTSLPAPSIVRAA